MIGTHTFKVTSKHEQLVPCDERRYLLSMTLKGETGMQATLNLTTSNAKELARFTVGQMLDVGFSVSDS